jgi:hypothetical protein
MSAPLPTASRWNTYSRSRYPRLWDGCVGAWCPSLGVSGARLFDYSVRQNWGTLTNMDPATDWVVDGGGYALDFDGANDVVQTVANIPELGTTGTLCCWVKFRTVNTGTHGVLSMQYGASPSDTYVLINQFGDSIFWYWGTQQNSFIAGAPGTGKWRHLAMANNGAAVVGYIDGVSVGSGTLMVSAAAQILKIGSFANLTIDGQIDDARVYSRALHPEEIRLLATRRAIAYEPEYWVPPIPEQVDSGIAKPVLFHSYYMSQGMRP